MRKFLVDWDSHGITIEMRDNINVFLYSDSLTEEESAQIVRQIQNALNERKRACTCVPAFGGIVAGDCLIHD